MSETSNTSQTESTKYDCIIAGAGPAGLTALEYLARFHRKAVALGAGGPRARLLTIDRTYNLPGYPQGVSGAALLERLREQALAMNGEIRDETVTHVDGANGDFTVRLSDNTELRARKIILAMGVRDRHPDIPNIEPHIGRFVRYCPVCDGFEHTGKHLGILGSGPAVARHALFLQTFSNRISVFLHGKPVESLGRYREVLRARDIEIFEPRVSCINTQCDADARGGSESNYRGCGIQLEDGSRHELAVLYSALGCDLHLQSVQHLKLDLDDDGYIITNCRQETAVPGIYAAGDLVSQINQISVAFGQAAIAAVSIHNALDDED